MRKAARAGAYLSTQIYGQKGYETNMKKTIMSLLLALAVTAGCLTGVYADGELKSDIFTYTVTNGNVTITGVDDARESVTVPDTIDGCPVTAIGDGAFGGSSKILTVYIPDSVTSIGETCFAYSPSLRSVRLSKSITAVPTGAFYQCDTLIGVSIPYGAVSIASNAFGMCSKLSAVTIPNSMQTIADDAFSGSPNVIFHCYLGEGAVGYTYAQNKGIKCEELITVYVNGNEVVFDQPPITEPKRFRTLVPLRSVLEDMGAEIAWVDDMEYAEIDIGGHRLLVKPNNDFMMVDGRPVTLRCPAIEYNNRVLLPIRDVVEAVGGKVGWDEFSKTVTITYNN